MSKHYEAETEVIILVQGDFGERLDRLWTANYGDPTKSNSYTRH